MQSLDHKQIVSVSLKNSGLNMVERLPSQNFSEPLLRWWALGLSKESPRLLQPQNSCAGPQYLVKPTFQNAGVGLGPSDSHV